MLRLTIARCSASTSQTVHSEKSCENQGKPAWEGIQVEHQAAWSALFYAGMPVFI
jgi:hypothetical protein